MFQATQKGIFYTKKFTFLNQFFSPQILKSDDFLEIVCVKNIGVKKSKNWCKKCRKKGRPKDRPYFGHLSN